MYLNQCLTDTLRNAKIASLGGPELADKMAQAQVNPVIKSKKWNENGEEQEAVLSTVPAVCVGGKIRIRYNPKDKGYANYVKED